MSESMAEVWKKACREAEAENAKLRARVEWLENTNFIRLRADYEAAILQNDRLKKMLNEIRGKAFKDVFSSEPSNFAAFVLKVIEDGYTEKAG